MELALILPLLLTICFAITELGRGIYTYNTLTKAARDAARYLSTQTAGDAAAITTANNLAVYGKPNPVLTGTSPDLPLMPGLTTGMVNICDASLCAATNAFQGTNPSINTVTVAITGYPFTPVIDLLGFSSMYKAGTTYMLFGNISVTMRQN